ncbi:MAG TPA: ROK family protein [Bacillota bacterium]|nr:ROK family protein [Bacillota bacterium]
MNRYFIGVDLGGTKIASVLTDSTGQIVASDKRPTNAAAGADEVVANIFDSIRSITKGVSQECLQGIGIASPGPVDIKQGVIIDAPNLGWKNFAISEVLEAEFQIPCLLENDANAAAIGEWVFGAGKGLHDLIYITVSTGVGGGIICNNQILHGRDDAAGEIGHIIVEADGPYCKCGKKGCLEAISSGTAIAAAARRLIGEGRPSSILTKVQNNPALINTQIVAAAAAEQDPLAVEILNRAIYFLGIGVANLIQIFNPELIIIGGGVSKIGSILYEGVWQVVVENTFAHTVKDLMIVPPGLGDACGTIGAAALAVRQFGQ